MSMTSHISAPLAQGESGTLSMRKKAQMKRRITKEHNSNFRAGYVPINEPYLYKAGIRGRKRFLLYCCFLALLIVAMLNLALTAWLIWIYRITHQGFEPMEFTRGPAGSLLRVLDTAMFETLSFNGASLGGRFNRNLIFSSHGIKPKILLSSSDSQNESKVEIGHDKIRMLVDDIVLWTPSGKRFFSLDDLKIAHLSNVRNLQMDTLETSEVKEVSYYNGLIVSSVVSKVTVTGATGVKVDSGKAAYLKAEKKNIHIKSSNSTTLNSASGLFLGVHLPKSVNGSQENGTLISGKLCVCGNNGRVFVVPVLQPGMGCHTANELKNPCVD